MSRTVFESNGVGEPVTMRSEAAAGHCTDCGKDRTLLVRIIGEEEAYCWPCASKIVKARWLAGAFTPEREAEGGTIEEAVS